MYNEPLKQWLGEHTYYRGQALLDVPLRGLLSLPLPNQSASVAGVYSFWRHRDKAATGYDAQRAGCYGRPQDCWAEYVVLGSGVDTTKVLDNLVLVSEGHDPDQLSLRTTEQPAAFEQALVGPPADITRRNAERREGHAWVILGSRSRARPSAGAAGASIGPGGIEIDSQYVPVNHYSILSNAASIGPGGIEM